MERAGPSIIEMDISEIEHACRMLEKSNKELAAFLQENGEDPELKAAIEDNLEALKVKRERIEDLRELKAKGIMPTFLSSDPGKEKTAITISNIDTPVEELLGKAKLGTDSGSRSLAEGQVAAPTSSVATGSECESEDKSKIDENVEPQTSSLESVPDKQDPPSACPTSDSTAKEGVFL
mmetsp:Transcript_8750/g.15366  ORF Transcript_8750/g.15366 Transcript_8750/m.15366 type:complete len:179 (+) Transcript_8750:149-685(+)